MKPTKLKVMTSKSSHRLDYTIFLLIILNALNFLDAYFTHIGVSQGYLLELNPLMSHLLDLGPFYFYTSKISLIFLASLILYTRNSHKLARIVIYSSVAYTGVLPACISSILAIWASISFSMASHIYSSFLSRVNFLNAASFLSASDLDSQT